MPERRGSQRESTREQLTAEDVSRTVDTLRDVIYDSGFQVAEEQIACIQELREDKIIPHLPPIGDALEEPAGMYSPAHALVATLRCMEIMLETGDDSYLGALKIAADQARHLVKHPTKQITKLPGKQDRHGNDTWWKPDNPIEVPDIIEIDHHDFFIDEAKSSFSILFNRFDMEILVTNEHVDTLTNVLQTIGERWQEIPDEAKKYNGAKAYWLLSIHLWLLRRYAEKFLDRLMPLKKGAVPIYIQTIMGLFNYGVVAEVASKLGQRFIVPTFVSPPPELRLNR